VQAPDTPNFSPAPNAIEQDAAFHVNAGGDVVPSYQGVNAASFATGEVADAHEPTADDLVEIYGDLAEKAFAATDVRLPKEIRVMVADHRARETQRRIDDIAKLRKFFGYDINPN